MTGGIGFSLSEFLDVGDSYQSLGYSHLQYQAGYTPVEVRMAFLSHVSPMVFQICPYVHEGREMPPILENHGEFKPTPWFFRLPVVNCGSAEKISFVMFDPLLERQKKYSIRDNPYMKLRTRVQRAVSSKQHEGWASLLKGSMDAPIPGYKDQYFVQGLVWTDGMVPVLNKQNLPVGLRPEDKQLALIRLSKTAIEPIRSAVVAAYMNGVESISLGRPKFFGIANRAKCKDIYEVLDFDKALARSQVAQTFAHASSITSMAEFAAFNAASIAAGVGETADAEEFVGYEAGMVERAAIWDKTELKMPIPPIDFGAVGWDAECRRKFVPWDKVFTVMSDQEQAVHIAKALADFPEVLQYAWGDTEFWTEEIVGILRKRMALRVNTGRLDDSIPGDAVLVSGVPTQASNAFAAPNIAQSAMNVFASNPHAAAAQAAAAQAAAAQAAAAQSAAAQATAAQAAAVQAAVGSLQHVFPTYIPQPTVEHSALPKPAEESQSDIMSRILGGGN